MDVTSLAVGAVAALSIFIAGYLFGTYVGKALGRELRDLIDGIKNESD